MPDKIKQADFAAQIRQRVPELKDFSDNELINAVIKRRPELKAQIETPDDAAAAEQDKLQKRSQSLVDPEFWQNHPILAHFVRSTLNTLPGAGAIAGGALATPETLGSGTLAGGALGAGAGRGLQDILSDQVLGLDKTSPVQKAKNIALDTGVTAVTPGVGEIAKNPITSAKMAAEDLANTSKYLIPSKLRPFLPFLETIGKKASSGVNPEVENAISHMRDYNNYQKFSDIINEGKNLRNASGQRFGNIKQPTVKDMIRESEEPTLQNLVPNSPINNSLPEPLDINTSFSKNIGKRDAWDTLLHETQNPPKLTGPEPNLNTGTSHLPMPDSEFIDSMSQYLSPRVISELKQIKRP